VCCKAFTLGCIGGTSYVLFAYYIITLVLHVLLFDVMVMCSDYLVTKFRALGFTAKVVGTSESSML